ncbi:MAG: HNH endonuclease [SAR324 cluster bacterium]|nr:HNH endonuclease [SAR324 cluster bacterium]
MASRKKRVPPIAYDIALSEEEIRRERAKARELKRTQWWKNRLGRGLCHYCRGRYHPKELTMDHIVPLVRGGKSARSNVVPCCRACNTAKESFVPSEWRAYLELLAARNPSL